MISGTGQRSEKEWKMNLSRRCFIGVLAAAALAGRSTLAFAVETVVTVHKDPNCGCCSGWVQHLRDAGFTVRVQETSDLEPVRALDLALPNGGVLGRGAAPRDSRAARGRHRDRPRALDGRLERAGLIRRSAGRY